MAFPDNQIIGKKLKKRVSHGDRTSWDCFKTDKEVLKSKSVKKFCWHKFFRMTKILHNLIIFILIACLSKSKIYECDRLICTIGDKTLND